jgi:hypothetical protein
MQLEEAYVVKVTKMMEYVDSKEYNYSKSKVKVSCDRLRWP